MTTTVVNHRVMKGQEPAEDYVYIGRPSKWGNPFVIGPGGDRAAVIRRYAEWIVDQPALLLALPELRDKRLGCYCRPEKPCHGDVLAAMADGRPVWEAVA